MALHGMMVMKLHGSYVTIGSQIKITVMPIGHFCSQLCPYVATTYYVIDIHKPRSGLAAHQALLIINY